MTKCVKNTDILIVIWRQNCITNLNIHFHTCSTQFLDSRQNTKRKINSLCDTIPMEKAFILVLKRVKLKGSPICSKPGKNVKWELPLNLQFEIINLKAHGNVVKGTNMNQHCRDGEHLKKENKASSRSLKKSLRWCSFWVLKTRFWVSKSKIIEILKTSF